jgi:hypothetical protein
LKDVGRPLLFLILSIVCWSCCFRTFGLIVSIPRSEQIPIFSARLHHAVLTFAYNLIRHDWNHDETRDGKTPEEDDD